MRYSSWYPFKLWPLKWWKIWFIFLALTDRINYKLCKQLGIPVRKYILPRIRVKIILSRMGNDISTRRSHQKNTVIKEV
jgi:hypothetical protein